MRKNLKKIVGCMAAMAFVFTSIVPFSVKANTYSNTYNFSYATGYANFISGAAAKDNTSSGSITCNGATPISSQGSASGASFNATMFGSRTSTGTFVNMIYNGYASKTYTVGAGVTKEMINYVKESGGNYAKIMATANSGSYVKFSGTWKADTK